MDPFDIRSAKRPRASLPWETGFAGLVFGKARSFCNVVPYDALRPTWDTSFVRAALVDGGSSASTFVEQEKLDEVVDGAAPAYIAVGRTKPVMPWTLKVDSDRQVAMERWRLLVTDNYTGSNLGVQLHDASLLECPQERIENIIADTFASKSTKTLEIRAGSLLLYSYWRRTQPKFLGVFPFVEADCYEYMSSLRVGHAPATRAKRFKESIGFALGTIGAKGAAEVLQSARCSGSAVRSMSTKQPHTQRDPLLVSQVMALERGVFELTNAADKIMAGNTAALLQVRGRFSDVHFCQKEPFVDPSEFGVSFFEIPVLDTKVSRKDKRRKVLPLVGISTGLTGTPWVAEWLRLRKLHGLNCADGPLFVAITATGEWTEGRLRSQEAMVWIRRILMLMKSPLIEGQLFGTHSLKCTILSWMAKAGCSLEHRNMMGFHASGAAESSLLYARAAYAGPLRALSKLLVHIREFRFRPDDTRSGTWCLTAAPRSRDLEEDDDEWAKGGKLIPGIDFEAVSVVDIDERTSEFEGSLNKSFSHECFEEPQVDEVSQDGFEVRDSMFRCSQCSLSHSESFSIFACDECGEKGCTHCMGVSAALGRIVCSACNILLNPLDLFDGQLDDAPLSSDSSESECSGESNSEVEESIAEIAAEAVAELRQPRRPARDPDDFLVQHKGTKTLHMLRKVDESEGIETVDDLRSKIAEGLICKLTCGRIFSDNFAFLRIIPVFDWPKCRTCFGDMKQDT